MWVWPEWEERKGHLLCRSERTCPPTCPTRGLSRAGRPAPLPQENF